MRKHSLYKIILFTENGVDPRHGGRRENGGGLARGELSLLLSFPGGEKESKAIEKLTKAIKK